MFPSADQIAMAIVTACGFTGDRPVATALCQASRGRHLAFAALIAAFPDARHRGLARCCGYLKPDQADNALYYARRTKWWSDDQVDEIVGVLVAPEYEERAA